MDAAKFGTWLHILRGAKIWAVLDGEAPDQILPYVDVSKYRWKHFLLEEDDLLFAHSPSSFIDNPR